MNLVGPEALSPAQRWVLEGAALIREGVLQQSALDPLDSYASPKKQSLLLALMLDIYHQGQGLLELAVPVEDVAALDLLARARRVKSTYSSEQIDELAAFEKEIRETFDQIRVEYGGAKKEVTA